MGHKLRYHLKLRGLHSPATITTQTLTICTTRWTHSKVDAAFEIKYCLSCANISRNSAGTYVVLEKYHSALNTDTIVVLVLVFVLM